MGLHRCYLGILLIFVVGFAGSAAARDVKTVRWELRPWNKERWAVVDVREVAGKVVVICPAVGREINLEACNRFAIFQGATVYNRKWDLPTLTDPVVGFQSAVFLKLSDGTFGVRIAYRDEEGVRYRFLRVRDVKEMRRIRNYFDQMAGVSDTTPGYPMETNQVVTFETVTVEYSPTTRVTSRLMLAKGETVRGKLLPQMENGQLLIETSEGFRRVDIPQVRKLNIGLRGGHRVIQKTLSGGITYGIAGGFAGLMAGGLENVRVKDAMTQGMMVGATVGAAFGFLDGILSLEPALVFNFDPSQGHSANKIEISPTRIRVLF